MTDTAAAGHSAPDRIGSFVVLDRRFLPLIIGHAQLERLWTGGRWTEGPVYVPAAKSVLWSDIPNDRVLRWDETDGSVSVFQSPCGHHNGHTLDCQGRVVACEHQSRRVARLDHDGRWRVLVDRFEGKRLNSPNDVVVRSDRSIWFSDPTYGIDSHYEGDAGTSELGRSRVYRFDPATGALTIAVDDMVQPNGLAFCPDETTLYVAETGRTHLPDLAPVIRAYPVQSGGTALGPGRVFATCGAGLFDGFRVDRAGNVWASSADGVRVFASDGTEIGRIPIPEIVSNLCFGGPKRNRLFITAQTSLYAIYVNTHPPGW